MNARKLIISASSLSPLRLAFSTLPSISYQMGPILALRRLAASIDLSYFFDTAEKRESFCSKLQTHKTRR